MNRLYSFNSGRIDYEPYQYRPVMKLINGDRPRLLIADDVGVGKTIEAGLIVKELQARQKLDSILVICPSRLWLRTSGAPNSSVLMRTLHHLDSATFVTASTRHVRKAGGQPDTGRRFSLPRLTRSCRLASPMVGDYAQVWCRLCRR